MPGLFDRLGSTKLTSLKFSDARDGFARQIDDEPLVVKSLPTDPYISTGYVGTAPNEKDAASENKERITRFFATPRGKAFINKQIGLQLSNTKIEGIAGLDALNLNLGPLNFNPNSVTSLINIGRDIANNGLNENNALSAISTLTRPTTRIGTSPLQNYNPQNTLDQIGSDPYTGWNHYDRFGSTNIIPNSDKYLYIATENSGLNNINRNGSPGNRLVKLQKSLGVGLESEKPLNELAEKLTTGFKKVNSFINKTNSYLNQGLGLVNSLGLQNDPNVQRISGEISKGFNLVNNKLALADKFIAPFTNNIIDQYEGGPGSLNGVGSTVIKRYENTSGNEKLPRILEAADASLRRKRSLISGIANISQQYQDDTGEDLFGNDFRNRNEVSYKVYETKNYETIRKTNMPKSRKSVAAVIVDPKAKTYTYNIEKQTLHNIDFDRTNKDSRYFGDSGKFEYFDRPTPSNTSLDRVVFTPINPFTGVPFDGGDPKYTGRIFFDAFVSNYRDNYTPTWTDINYIGRSETFHIFSKFKRDISFTLQVPCFNPRQLNARHRALSELASVNAGTYNNGKLGGIITYLKLGNYLAPNSSQPNSTPIVGEPGIITSFNISIPNDSSWDIDEQLAHYLTVDIGFSLIHNAQPQWSRGGWLNNIGEYIDETFNPVYNTNIGTTEIFSNPLPSPIPVPKIINVIPNKPANIQLPEVKLPADFERSNYNNQPPPLDSVPFYSYEDA
jgi:hypothetical protein